MIREAFDDFNRFLRDRDVNNQKYKKLMRTGVVDVESARIKVGDLIIVEKVRHWNGIVLCPWSLLFVSLEVTTELSAF